MDDKLNALDKLIEAVEAGNMPLDGSSYKLLGDGWLHVFDAYHGSIDAALALHEALLSGWVFRITGGGPMPLGGDYRIPHVHVFKPRMTEDDEPLGANSFGVNCDAPARAWLLAILRAYRSVQA